jgi:hypothetical protein
VKRSKGDNNHGVGWGMTAVEMGLLRMSALGQGKVHQQLTLTLATILAYHKYLIKC